nr:hypothetical protein [Acetobacter syzygii]
MSEKRRLTEAVTVRLEPKVYTALMDRAHARGITGNSLVRKIIESSMDDVDLATIIVRERQKPRKAQPDDVLAIASLRESVAETCGALVQCSIKARTENNPELHKRIERLLPDVVNAVHDLDKLKKRLMRISG